MLKKLRSAKPVGPSAVRGTFAIVASKYNRRYVDGMLHAATRQLRQAGVERIHVVRVPGAFEIPVVAARLARPTSDRVVAIICLGVVLQGETSHAQHIGESVSNALSQIQILREVPVIHEVLVFDKVEQARVRCLSRDHNRGTEAAQTALEMARVMHLLP